MSLSKHILPSGMGFEQDYDKYETVPNRKFSSSDDWWKNFCLAGEEEFEKSEIKNDLIKALNNDIYLAMAVNHFVGVNFKQWLDKEGIEMLGGLTPRECLKSEHGKKRLKMLFLTAGG